MTHLNMFYLPPKPHTSLHRVKKDLQVAKTQWKSLIPLLVIFDTVDHSLLEKFFSFSFHSTHSLHFFLLLCLHLPNPLYRLFYFYVSVRYQCLFGICLRHSAFVSAHNCQIGIQLPPLAVNANYMLVSLTSLSPFFISSPSLRQVS